MTAGHTPTASITALYNNTTPGTTADPAALDNAIADIVQTIDDNYDFAAGLISAGALSALGIINVKDYGASGSDTTTTGNLASGSKVLVVTSTDSFSVGHGVSVAGAGDAGADLVTSITSIVGTNVFLVDEASTAVAAAVVSHDDTEAIQAAIDAADTAGGGVVLLPMQSSAYKITSTIFLKSNVYLVSQKLAKVQGVNVMEIIKTDASSNYNNIRLINIHIDAGKSPEDDNILICAQFYNVTNLAIIGCKFSNASAAVGIDTCEDIILTNNTVEGMFQQTSGAATFAGTYGYGFVLNECNNALIDGNFLGTQTSGNTQIDRHSVYVSNHNPATNQCRRVKIINNSIVQNVYDDSTDMVTGFEYAIKAYSGDHVDIIGNTVIGGAGPVLLTWRGFNAERVNIEGNTFIDGYKTGIYVVAFESGEYEYNYNYLVVKNNYIKLKGQFAIGIEAMNVLNLYVESNTFISSLGDDTYKNPCYRIRLASEENHFQADSITIRGNTVKGFSQVGYFNNVDFLNVDDYIVDYPASNDRPVTYTENVTLQKIKVRYLTSQSDLKTKTDAGLVGLTYYDDDFGFEITCTQVSPSPIWRDAAGNTVVATSTTRPTSERLNSGFKMWEQDLDRFVFWTGWRWNTTYTSIPVFGTNTSILTYNPGSAYSGVCIYSTTDKKPYWWDGGTSQWKDAVGTVMV